MPVRILCYSMLPVFSELLLHCLEKQPVYFIYLHSTPTTQTDKHRGSVCVYYVFHNFICSFLLSVRRKFVSKIRLHFQQDWHFLFQTSFSSTASSHFTDKLQHEKVFLSWEMTWRLKYNLGQVQSTFPHNVLSYDTSYFYFTLEFIWLALQLTMWNVLSSHKTLKVESYYLQIFTFYF